MCGICGVVDVAGRGRVDREALLRMRDRLTHRGPDDAGVHHEAQAGLAMTRLQVIDVATGHQPMANETETVWVVCNGEIYNFQTLRDSLTARGHRFRSHGDVEVIVHLYEEYGDACVEHLEGMFAFALWDQPRRHLLLARDRMGIKPLYYAEAEGTIVFASELKALVHHPQVSRALDLRALDQYLTLEYVPAPRTIYQGVRKLLPGHRLVAHAGTIIVEPYWRLPVSPSPSTTDEAALCEQWRTVLRHSVRRHLISDVPVGLLLSGGLDSSAIAALMRREISGPIHSYTVGFDDASFDESAYARMVAASLGLTHHEERLTSQTALALLPAVVASLDEPLGDASAIPTYLVSRMARREVVVALSGDGGDELFAGYPTYPAHRLAAWYRRVPQGIRRRVIEPVVRALPTSRANLSLDFLAKRFIQGMELSPAAQHLIWMGSFDGAAKQQLLSAAVQAELAGGVSHPAQLVEDLGDGAGASGTNVIETILQLDLRTYLPNDLLPKVDLMSMANSLEVRVPFLDHHVVAFACGLPSAWKLRGMTTKYLMRRALAGLLPRPLVGRPKKGFGIPMAKWLRGPWRSLLQDVLHEDLLRREGLVNPSYVRRLVTEHLRGTADHRKLLWTLLVFHLWSRVAR